MDRYSPQRLNELCRLVWSAMGPLTLLESKDYKTATEFKRDSRYEWIDEEDGKHTSSCGGHPSLKRTAWCLGSMQMICPLSLSDQSRRPASWFYGLSFWTRVNAEVCLLAMYERDGLPLEKMVRNIVRILLEKSWNI